MDELTIDEVQVAQLLLFVVHCEVHIVVFKPLLALLCLALVEAEVDSFVIFSAFVAEYDLVSFKGSEILLRLLVSRCSQTLVILNLPPFRAPTDLLHPAQKVLDTVKAVARTAAGGLDDGCDETLHKAVMLAQKCRPEVV